MKGAKMLSKEVFLEKLHEIIKIQEDDDRLDRALKEVAPSDFTGFSRIEYTNKLLDELSEDMHDEEDDYIGWWLYDCPERGQCEYDDECTVWLQNDRPFVIRTEEDLYDFLVYNYKEGEESPSDDAMLRRAQMDGVRYAINIITKLRHVNQATDGAKSGEYEALMQYLSDKIRNEYALDTGIFVEQYDNQEIILFSNESE